MLHICVIICLLSGVLSQTPGLGSCPQPKVQSKFNLKKVSCLKIIIWSHQLSKTYFISIKGYGMSCDIAFQICMNCIQNALPLITH